MQDKNDNYPLDLSYLKEMVGNNPEFIAEVFDSFIEQTPIYLLELEDALSVVGNWDQVANCAHKIKPTYSYVGRSDVKDLVQKIESDARNRIEFMQIRKDVEQLKVLSNQIYMQLERAKKDILPYME